MTSVKGGTVSKGVAHTLQNNTTTATLLMVLTVLRYLYIILSRCNTQLTATSLTGVGAPITL